jgi:hypothetical protein
MHLLIRNDSDILSKSGSFSSLNSETQDNSKSDSFHSSFAIDNGMSI